MENEVNHLAHLSHSCEYPVVFAPKYGRREIYGERKADIEEIMRNGAKKNL